MKFSHLLSILFVIINYSSFASYRHPDFSFYKDNPINLGFKPCDDQLNSPFSLLSPLDSSPLPISSTSPFTVFDKPSKKSSGEQPVPKFQESVQEQIVTTSDADAFVLKQACPNEMGCLLVYYCQQRYKELHPESAELLTKQPEIEDEAIRQEVKLLAGLIPDIDKDSSGNLIEPLFNKDTKEWYLPFKSKNDFYQLALNIIKPHNNPQGFQNALDLVKENKSLGYAEQFQMSSSLICNPCVVSENRLPKKKRPLVS